MKFMKVSDPLGHGYRHTDTHLHTDTHTHTHTHTTDKSNL